MDYDQYEKDYLANLKSALTTDQWLSFLELDQVQQKAYITGTIDVDISQLDFALSNLDVERNQRESNLSDRKTKLLNLKTKVESL